MGKVTFSGLFTKEGRDTWNKYIKKEFRDAAKNALEESFKEIKGGLETHLKQQLQIKSKAFARSFGKNIYDKDQDKLPGMVVYASRKVRYIMDTLENGATISVKKSNYLVVPMAKPRMKPKQFKDLISNLVRQNCLWIHIAGNKKFLMAHVTKENTISLNKFKKMKKTYTNKKKVKVGEEVLIATLVKTVRIRKKINFVNTVKKYEPQITQKLRDSLNLK